MVRSILSAISEGLLDTLKVIPFLLITFLAMEWLEHHTQEKTIALVRRSDRFGPMLGGLLGIIPQCGFSASAASLFAGRVITAGTMIAVFLSTSDEMLPILISRHVPWGTISSILLTKAVIGVIFGFLVDFLFRQFNMRRIGSGITDICKRDGCSCEKEGILLSALKHTAEISAFLAMVTILMNLLIRAAGEEAIAHLFLNRPLIGELIAGLIGLIPNCAASVLITTLYMEGGMSAGAMIAGLLTGAGVGLLVLFRNHRRKKENIQLVMILYVCGVLGGFVINLLGIRY